MAARLSSAAKTDVGLKRTNNEDNYIVVPSHGLYVLADGMGGHASGQVASSMCVSHVAKFICEISRQPGFELPYKPNPGISREANLLVNAIKFANERVYIQSCKERSMEGMGTTVTAIFNAPHGLVLAHVGDSRIYRVRNGQITQMSRDHSLMNHLLDTGELKPEDVPNFANKNVILRAIGLKENVDVEVKEVPREKGDVYMMCSDGLSDIVSDAQIAQAISSAPNLTEACNTLIALALKAGGKDNVTVVCVSIDQEDGAQAMPSPGAARTNMPSVNSMAAMNPAGAPPISAQSVPPVSTPLGMGPGQNGRAASQPMMTRAPSYGAGMASVTMPMPKPMNMNGMMPMPPRGMGMGMGNAMVPPQPQQPVRMHSVREVVEIVPAARPMPKMIGSAGRSAASGMPSIPVMGKGRTSKPEAEPPVKEEVAQAVTLDSAVLIESEDSGRPTVHDNPIFLCPPPVAMKEVSKLSAEEKSELPEAGLLFTEPPVSAFASNNSSEPTFNHEETQEFEDEDEDEDKTLVQRAPAIVNEKMAADILHDVNGPHTHNTIPDAKPIDGIWESKSPSGTQPAGGTAVLLSPSEFESEYESTADESVKRNVNDSARRGYIPPKDVVLPPHHSYDEDDDNIEIADILFGNDGEDEDVTRQFRRPPIKKW